jgi:hypothetical protein
MVNLKGENQMSNLKLDPRCSVIVKIHPATNHWGKVVSVKTSVECGCKKKIYKYHDAPSDMDCRDIPQYFAEKYLKDMNLTWRINAYTIYKGVHIFTAK